MEYISIHKIYYILTKKQLLAEFEAAVSLLRDRGQEGLLEEVYAAAKADLERPMRASENEVKRLFEAVSTGSISQRIGEILTPPDLGAEVQILYQTVEGLHAACPEHGGDWYFTGDYPIKPSDTLGEEKIKQLSLLSSKSSN